MKSDSGAGRLFSLALGLFIAVFVCFLFLSSMAWSAPVQSKDQVERYLEDNDRDLSRKLTRYNEEHRINTTNSNDWKVSYWNWKVDLLEEDRVFLYVNYAIGPTKWNPAWAKALFELQWRDGELEFVGHQTQKELEAAKADPSESVGGPPPNDKCTHNYFDPHPCLDTHRIWKEFVEFHDFEQTRESAAIFQAYKEHNVGEGDRLMARARGLPDPAGKSAFGLLDDVRALNLDMYRGRQEAPCGFNIFLDRPCPGAKELFEAFLEKHGLEPNLRTASMFAAYAEGDFRTADTQYAMEKGLPVPAYGYQPTGVARDVAGMGLNPRITREQACSYNPYAALPCLDSKAQWLDFAARYGLEDSRENAEIFQAYTEGTYKVADQLLAQAKGVTHEQ
ncbi:MAG: hypothetical protein AAF530_07940, partial [Pseudomonadota bacterium]